MTIVLLRHNPLPMDSSSMEPDTFTLATLLALATLIAATIEYAEMVRRRITIRADATDGAILEERGLRGLVRVFLADAGPSDGTLRTVRSS